MDRKIITCSTLRNLVEIDNNDNNIKDIAILFLNAMNDWPTYNQIIITEFLNELHAYFGTPLTIPKIESKKFDGQNAWQITAGSSITELIDASIKYFNESDFNTIVTNILNYYEQEFSKLDIIAEIKMLTNDQGGRQTPAKTNIWFQIKFDFSIMQIGGLLNFIDKEIIVPGNTVLTKIKFLFNKHFENKLAEEMNFDIYEGEKKVGTGTIKKIINETLEKSQQVTTPIFHAGFGCVAGSE